MKHMTWATSESLLSALPLLSLQSPLPVPLSYLLKRLQRALLREVPQEAHDQGNVQSQLSLGVTGRSENAGEEDREGDVALQMSLQGV